MRILGVFGCLGPGCWELRYCEAKLSTRCFAVAYLLCGDAHRRGFFQRNYPEENILQLHNRNLSFKQDHERLH